MAHNDDDLYVNAGDSYDTTYYPDENEDEARQEADKHEALKAASYPILGSVADWFEDCIKACDSLDNIVFDMTKINGVEVDRKISVEAQVLAMTLLKAKFIEKYRDFEEFRNER